MKQRILYYKRFNKFKKAHNSNAINKFEKFKNIFANNKNVTNCKIFNFLKLIDNNAKNLVKINNNKVKIK